jgi:hypothetical protein
MRLFVRWSLFLRGLPGWAWPVISWIAGIPVAVLLVKLMHGGVVLLCLVLVSVAVTTPIVRRSANDLTVASEKRVVTRAVLLGESTGDATLDAYALDNLEHRRRVGQLPENFALTVVILGIIAAPVLAGIAYSAWWLSMLPVDMSVAAGLVAYLGLDVDHNIRRLQAPRPPGDGPT